MSKTATEIAVATQASVRRLPSGAWVARCGDCGTRLTLGRPPASGFWRRTCPACWFVTELAPA